MGVTKMTLCHACAQMMRDAYDVTEIEKSGKFDTCPMCRHKVWCSDFVLWKKGGRLNGRAQNVRKNNSSF